MYSSATLRRPAYTSTACLSAPTVRYGQCWEDADILREALQIQPGDVCLSIASAGDNTLALLTMNPGRVVAIDANPSQLACLELRVAAYKNLSYTAMMEMLGHSSADSDQRLLHYSRCRASLSDAAVQYWDARKKVIAEGRACVGKFESYFTLFRRIVLPLVHDNRTVRNLLKSRNPDQRTYYYHHVWNTPLWRLIFSLFFSRAVMGTFGRDRQCFQHVEGAVSKRIFARTEYALTKLDPGRNPYLHWILTGRFGEELPVALREENFGAIKANLYKLELKCGTLESVLDSENNTRFDCFNLSDIFEYMPANEFQRQVSKIVEHSSSGARLAYWNMLNDRRASMTSSSVQSNEVLAQQLHLRDRAFFYSKFVVEAVQ